MDAAFFEPSRELVQLCSSYFLAFSNNFAPISVTNNNALSYMENVELVSQKSHIMVLQTTPCFASHLEYADCDEIGLPDLPQREFLINSLLEHYNYIKKQETFSHYISINGINDFVKNGIIPEIPLNFISPCSLKLRKKLLEKLIDQNTQKCSYNIVDQEKLKIPDNLAVEFCGQNNLVFYMLSLTGNPSENFLGKHMIQVAYKSVIQDFKFFIEYIKRNRFFYSKDYKELIIKRLIHLLDEQIKQEELNPKTQS